MAGLVPATRLFGRGKDADPDQKARHDGDDNDSRNDLGMIL
jgi:hypothetical protein